jgi:hypothetical protein
MPLGSILKVEHKAGYLSDSFEITLNTGEVQAFRGPLKNDPGRDIPRRAAQLGFSWGAPAPVPVPAPPTASAAAATAPAGVPALKPASS